MTRIGSQPLSPAVASATYAPLSARISVNVKDYGAKGDGVTDDTLALRAALAAVGAVGGRLYFPAGTYIVSAVGGDSGMSLTSEKGVELFGDGLTATIIHNPARMFPFAPLWIGSNASNVVRDMRFNGPGQSAVADATLASPADTGISVFSGGRLRIENVVVQNFSTGMRVEAVGEMVVINNEVSTNRCVGLRIEGVSGRFISLGCSYHVNGASATPAALVANVLVKIVPGAIAQGSLMFLDGQNDEVSSLGGNAGGTNFYIHSGVDITIQGAVIHAGGKATTPTNPFYGIYVGAAASRVTVRDTRIEPWIVGDADRKPANTILIASGATGVVLDNVTTDPNGGGDISDSGTGTVWQNVNGINNKVASLSALAPFTPNVIGTRYVNPLCRGYGNTSRGLNVLLAHLFYSGADGVTISQLDHYIATAGATGAVVRIGLWTVDDQVRPFKWTAGTQWATLIGDYGTVITTATGAKTLSPTPVVIPPRTWFAVGGVEQVATSSASVGQAGGAGSSPLGVASTAAVPAAYMANTPGVAIGQTGVTGALGNLVPTGSYMIDAGIGISRSA